MSSSSGEAGFSPGDAGFSPGDAGVGDLLARRYERLLWFYPAAYRRERGDELLDTLLSSAADSSPDRSSSSGSSSSGFSSSGFSGGELVSPPRREVVALVLGGLRARAGRDKRQSVRLSWLAGVRAAALMLLVAGIARPGSWMLSDSLAGVSSFWPWQQLIPLTIGLVALILALLGRYVWSIGAALVAFALAQAVTWGSPLPNLIPNMWELPLAVVLMVPLVRHPPGRVSGVLRWAPIVPLALLAVEWLSPEIWPEHSGLLQRAIHLGVVVGALVWLAVDERVAMALGFLLLYTVLIQVGYQVGGPPVVDARAALAGLVITVLPPALLLVGASVRSRHTAGL